MPLTINTDPGGPLVDHGEPLERWVCWDLQADALVHGTPLRNRGLISAPEPLWTANSADALVMKAMMLYDRP